MQVLLAVGASFALVGPALAGNPVPGPLVGAGLPVLIVLAGAYLVVRAVQKRGQADQ